MSAVNAFPRDFVGLNTTTGTPVSFWTGDAGPAADMALSMAGNQGNTKVGVHPIVERIHAVNHWLGEHGEGC